MHRLSFTLPLADSPDLIFGNLKLTYPDGHAIDYLATSGCAGWQRPKDQSARARGPIPAGEYEIPTTPYWLGLCVPIAREFDFPRGAPAKLPSFAKLSCLHDW
ncbi:hypothetical protein [Microcoleus sp. CAWBG640]|uniref:hypothetical protein n=1 Tax=Microcoleus sp. CAWBG640 TaxID=2841653 RepID=UPI00312BAF2B